MKAGSKGGLWGLLFLALAGGIGLRLAASSRPPRPPARELPFLGTVPDFTLTERSGKPVSAKELAGRVWIADFIFTRCSSVCPLMTAKMEGLRRELSDLPSLRFVSFTVDPAWDSPKRLSTYADIYTQDKERWFFLTGKKEAVHALIRNGFRLTAQERPPSKVPPGEDPIIHSQRFVLVDGELRIRGYYDALEAGSLETLEDDVRALLKSPSRHGIPAMGVRHVPGA